MIGLAERLISANLRVAFGEPDEGQSGWRPSHDRPVPAFPSLGEPTPSWSATPTLPSRLRRSRTTYSSPPSVISSSIRWQSSATPVTT